MPVLSQKQYLSVEEVAVKLNVCADTVRREYRKGKLLGFKVGWRLRFSEENLAEYIEQQSPVRVPLAQKH